MKYQITLSEEDYNYLLRKLEDLVESSGEYDEIKELMDVIKKLEEEYKEV